MYGYGSIGTHKKIATEVGREYELEFDLEFGYYDYQSNEPITCVAMPDQIGNYMRLYAGSNENALLFEQCGDKLKVKFTAQSSSSKIRFEFNLTGRFFTSRPYAIVADIDNIKLTTIDLVEQTQMLARSVASEKYRFGFNGKENDTDFGNKQVIQDYGFRVYNPSIGKFLSTDPLAKSYSWYTPYQFAGNKPIWVSNLDALEEKIETVFDTESFKAQLKVSSENLISFNFNYAIFSDATLHTYGTEKFDQAFL